MDSMLYTSTALSPLVTYGLLIASVLLFAAGVTLLRTPRAQPAKRESFFAHNTPEPAAPRM